MKWKNMDSAPKDGTRVLLYLKKHDVAVSGLWGEIHGERDGPHVYYESFYDWCVDDDIYILDDPSEVPTFWCEFPRLEIKKDEGE